VKVGLAVERTGVPVGVEAAAADTAEVDLAEPVLATIPEGVGVPWDVPVIADRAYDSDPLRGRLAGDGFRLLAPHRKNRTKPPTNDGRRMRRYRRRYIVERTIGWLHSYRRVLVRHEWWEFLYHGFVQLACTFIALGRL
jgi:transposase